jgi:hypothetical protein
MNKIANVNVPRNDLSVALSNDKAYTITATPTIPARFDGWAYSIDGSLYKTLTSSDAYDILFSSEGTKTLYFRALNIVNGEEILDSEVITGSQNVELPAVKSIQSSSYSGWNYSSTYTTPGGDAGGSNNKSFGNFSRHGHGYYHPSSTNKQKMFDGNPNTYAGDYFIQNWATSVWEKIAIDSNVDSGTISVKFSTFDTSQYSSDRSSPGHFLCSRRSDQAFNGTSILHYNTKWYNPNVRTYTLHASRWMKWDGGVVEKTFNYNINFTGGIEEILLGIFNMSGNSGTERWGMRIHEVSVSS